MKKLISVMLVTLLILFSITVSADSVAGSTTVDVNYSVTVENTVTISGTAVNIPKNAQLTVSVFHKDKTVTDLPGTGASAITAMAALEKVSLDESLSWSFDWQPTASGDYDIYVSSKFFEKPVKNTCYLAANRSTVVNTIVTGDEAELSELFSDDDNIKAVIIDGSLYENIEDTSKIGIILNTLKQEFETEAEILSLLPVACSLAALSETPGHKLMDEIVSELETLGCGFTESELYGDSSEAVKDEVAAKLADKVNNKISDLDPVFTEALILSGVEKSTNYVTVIDYLELLSDRTFEKDKTAAAEAVVGNEYTMEQLLDAIKEAVEPEDDYSDGPSFSGGGGGGGGGGGFVAMSGNIVTPVIKEEEAKKDLVTFTDVPGTHWAFDAINNLRWKDIVSGNEKGEFLPDNNITRAEIVKMVCELYDITGSGNASYDDVSENHWAFRYISAATANNIVMGDGACFNPDQFISRQDLATIIYRVTQKYGKSYEDGTVDFGDSNAIADYAAEAVGKLYVAGIIKGKTNGLFEPAALSTRAEAATIIYRLQSEMGVE